MKTEKQVKSARVLVKYLRERHRGQVFVEECKLGSSMMRGNGALRMDAFAMRPSFSTLTTIGYEIKVSKSDFVRDKKWTEYLPACSHFYFVTPAGLLDRRQIPDPAGLIELMKAPYLHPVRKWDSAKPDRPEFRVVKRAKRMPVDESALLLVLKYIAFWRAGKKTDIVVE